MVCAWLFTSFVVVYCCDQLYCFLDLGIFWAGGVAIPLLRLARYFSANAKTHRKHRSRGAVFSVRLICMGIG